MYCLSIHVCYSHVGAVVKAVSFVWTGDTLKLNVNCDCVAL